MKNAKEKIMIGVMTFILAVSVIYIFSPENVKMRVDYDKSTFYVLENSRWVVSGREYNLLFDGASKMYRSPSNIEIEYYNTSNTMTIIRKVPYLRGPVIKDTYFFNGELTDVENFPIFHTVEIYNASGYYYRYEVRDLVYDGESKKLEGTDYFFGRNMKVEWQDGYRWARVYKSGILKVQYDIPSDYEIYSVRLYDPLVELNFTATLSGNITTFTVLPETSNATEVQPNGQNSTLGILNITNHNASNGTLQLKVNGTVIYPKFWIETFETDFNNSWSVAQEDSVNTTENTTVSCMSLSSLNDEGKVTFNFDNEREGYTLANSSVKVNISYDCPSVNNLTLSKFVNETGFNTLNFKYKGSDENNTANFTVYYNGTNVCHRGNFVNTTWLNASCTVPGIENITISISGNNSVKKTVYFDNFYINDTEDMFKYLNITAGNTSVYSNGTILTNSWQNVTVINNQSSAEIWLWYDYYNAPTGLDYEFWYRGVQ